MSINYIWEILAALIIGFIQGVTEFLPISSTAHIRLAVAVLAQGKDITVATSNIIQLATLIAIIQYFWIDLKQYFTRIIKIISNSTIRQEFVRTFKTWLKQNTPETTISGNIVQNSTNLANQNTKQLESLRPSNKIDIEIAQLAVGTVPILILGYLLKPFADRYRDLGSIAIFLIAGSILMILAEYLFHKAKKTDKTDSLSVTEVVLIGLFQSLAIFPGVSRSGATISGALLLGRPRAESIRFSFLLSIPALGIAGLLGIWDVIKSKEILSFLPSADFLSKSSISFSVIGLVIGFASAYLCGWFSLKWLLKYLADNNFKNFIIYRLILASILILTLVIGWF